ncbi:hypothetical protein M8C21_029452 [Ambrosia artemisiifolia]|uniref:Uncharacterized protein n=1 Tax=Ambrosia artemisiifolia TaxID=4212 RepID=A0AAD5D829_AMBAR|nr:hypothetical protein M8C21_029452 [Ambrosia artemisiifolia]
MEGCFYTNLKNRNTIVVRTSPML